MKGYPASRSITLICALAGHHFGCSLCPALVRKNTFGFESCGFFPSRQLKHPLLTEDAEVPKKEVEAMLKAALSL